MLSALASRQLGLMRTWQPTGFLREDFVYFGTSRINDWGHVIYVFSEFRLAKRFAVIVQQP